MEEILEVVFQILGFVIEAMCDCFFYGPGHGRLDLSDLWEWVGYLGASTWLILSLGRVQWENLDWRATSTGVVIMMGGLSALAWFGLHHYAVSVRT